MSWDASRILPALQGRWALRRAISGMARMEGFAAFVPDGIDGLRYEERVRVSMAAGGSHMAHRRYRFRPLQGGFSVWFEEEPLRLFHALPLREAQGWLVGEAVHLCGADRYDSRYRFGPGADAFELQHAVSGPRKRYVSETWYARDR